MKAKAPKWPIIPFLVCIALCVGLSLLLSGRAFALDSADAVPASGVIVEIAPPTGYADKSAEIGFTITDTAGDGFASAKVKLGLDGEWRDVTDTLERWESRYTGRVTITDNCAVTVKVTGHDGKVYEKMCYVNCFEHGTQIFLPNGTQDNPCNGQAPSNTPAGTTTDGGSGGADATPTPPASSSNDPDSQPDTTSRNPTALTPDGQGTVMDNVTDGDGKEFFTFTTPSENTFYLVIDRQRDSENVYFLNAVTENDLLALAAKDGDNSGTSAVPDPAPVCICKDKCEAGAVNTACPACVLSMSDCAGTAPAPAESQKPEQPKDNNTGTIVIVLLAMLAVGGAGWYFKIYKPKHDMSDAEDFDELTGGGDEPMVNEDEEPEARTRQEPEEPDYPPYYDDEPDEPDEY